MSVVLSTVGETAAERNVRVVRVGNRFMPCVAGTGAAATAAAYSEKRTGWSPDITSNGGVRGDIEQLTN